MSYYPGLKPLIIKVERDHKYIHEMDKLINQFNMKMQECKEQLNGSK